LNGLLACLSPATGQSDLLAQLPAAGRLELA